MKPEEAMTRTTITERLAGHSRSTGIPPAELKRSCICAGLDLLDRGELKVRKPTAGSVPAEAGDVTHFCRISRRGASPAASSGERVANRLALALHRIGDDMAVLDSGAIEGACSLLRCMAGPWATDDRKAAVFRVVKQAAGK